MTSQRIIDFIETHRPSTPCLIVDINVVRENYRALARSLPNAEIYYAVKANPDHLILTALDELGSSFDTASVAEIEMVMTAGTEPSRISFGNTIKKESDIARAYSLGVRLFAVDCCEEVDKIARAAPDASIFCRILTDGAGAEWPLSRKFGCTPNMAVKVLAHAQSLDLDAAGVSFHVGSQQTDLSAWDRAIGDAKSVFDATAELGISLRILNLGGGFPTRYLINVPTIEAYGSEISKALQSHFGNHTPRTIIEPGRSMVGSAGAILSEVVLVARKDDDDHIRWVYLDIGKFGGLAETMDETIRYSLKTSKDGGDVSPCVVAGPTCDSADVLYERTPYPLPINLQAGDNVLIEGTGAYTSTYSAVSFNGFRPLRTYTI